MRTNPLFGADLCGACVAQSGLCARHAEHVCPQLAVNLGWLRLIGDAVIEQTRRQHIPAPKDAAAVERAKRREQRKRERTRGMRGLTQSLLAA